MGFMTATLDLRRSARRRWTQLVSALGADVDHGEVAARIEASGRLGGGYLMMTAVSAAIAVLGLLLSSPAVVIGAMLVSPLMGPIIALGFAFWRVDWAGTRRAMASLAVGLGLALFVSVLLVTISPLKEPTAEILARSRPTLFDLLVAIFSGVAGGYAVVRQRGETVIGVAIATALMPPLATMGFGLSTRAWGIAGGALLLFFTNLIAIALAAAGVAAVSGFAPRKRENGRGEWAHHAAVLAVLAALCVPLTLSLRTIALEGRATTLARSELRRVFGPKARVTSLSVRDDGQMDVEALVATPKLVGDANSKLKQGLTRALHTPVKVRLDQVVLADPSQLRPTPAPAPGGPPPSEPAADLRAAVPFPDAMVLTAGDGAGVVRLGADSGLDLVGARALEVGLRRRPGFQDVSVVPPLQPLAPIILTAGDPKTPPTLVDAALQAWALQRWRAASVNARLCPSGSRPKLTDLQPPIETAFKPLPVSLQTGDPATCRAAGAKRPFLLVDPGPASNPVEGARTASSGTSTPPARPPERP